MNGGPFDTQLSAVGEAGGRNFVWLQSRLAALLWLALLLLVLTIGLQMLVGWPFTQRVPVSFREDALQPDGLIAGRISSRYPILAWNSPGSRVQWRGREIPSYRSRERLQAAAPPAAWIKSHGVYLKLEAADKPESKSCSAVISWLPPWSVSIGVLAAFVLWTGALHRVRNPHLGRLWRLGGQIPLSACVTAGALLVGVLLRSGGFAFPAWHMDTDEFLKPAIDLASHRPMSVTDRPLGYSAVIGLVLRFFPKLRAVLILHEVSSLVFGVAIAIILHVCARRLFSERRRLQGLAILGGVSAALWSWHEGILFREWQILPEALIPGYLALQIWLFWRICTRPLRGLWSVGEFAVFCALGWIIFFTKPNWALALLLLPVPWICAIMLQRSDRKTAIRWLVAGAAVCLISILGGAFIQRLTPANTAASVEIRSRVLICWHLDMVRPEVKRRLQANPAPHEGMLLEELGPILDEELALTQAQGPGAYPVLGYDADRLYYFGFLKAKLYRQMPAADRVSFCRGLFLGALQRHPYLYLRHVVRQTCIFLERPYGSAAIYLPHRLEALTIAQRFAKRRDSYLPAPMLADYRREVGIAESVLPGPWPTAARMALSLRVRPIWDALGYSFAATVICSIATVAAALVWPRWRRNVPWRRYAPVMALGIWALGSAFGSALSSSIAQALEIQRYIDLFMPVTLLAHFIWPLLALAVVLDATAGRGLKDKPAHP